MGAWLLSPERIDRRIPLRRSASLAVSPAGSPASISAEGDGEFMAPCLLISSIWNCWAAAASARCFSKSSICWRCASACALACSAACCWAALCVAACCCAAACISACCFCAACCSCLLGPLRPPPPNQARQGERMGFSWWSVSRIAFGVSRFRKSGAGGLADSMRCRGDDTERSCKGYFD